MRTRRLSDADGYFADRATRALLGSLFVDPNATADWQSVALCAQVDGDCWFPEKGGSTRDAKRICSDCTVRAECLEYALVNNERWGIWGGLSERERRRLSRIAA